MRWWIGGLFDDRADDPDLPPLPAPPLLPLLGVVAAGGSCGALGRYALAVALPHSPSGLPWATLLANVVGCLLLGLIVAALPDAHWLRPFLGTGVLGGFTTFSTLALETDRLLARAPATALVYVALTLGLGLGAAVLGLRLGTAGRPA